MMEIETTKEHAWLKKFVGEWAYEGRSDSGPDGKPMAFDGRETVRAIGDLWVQGESSGACAGMDSKMVVTIGFDPAKGRFVGNWVGSMMPNMFVYEGWIEEDGRTLVLETRGSCPMNPGTERTFRDITEFVSDDHRRFRAEMRGDDGSWTRLMDIDFHRVK